MPRLRILPAGFVRTGDSVARPLREDRDSSANYWYFHSNKLNSLLLIESDVLFASVVMLELRPDVVSYDGLAATASSDDPESAADVAVRFADGHRELWYCRRNVPPADWCAPIPEGTRGRLITGEDIGKSRYLFDNALMLSGAITAARDYDHSATCHALLKKFAVQATTTVEEIESIPDHDPALLRAALALLLADGTLSADLETQLLSPQSVIGTGEGHSTTSRPALPGTLTTDARGRPGSLPEPDTPEGDALELLPPRRLIPGAYVRTKWPTPEHREVPDADRPRYNKCKTIVDDYRRGRTYQAICEAHSVSEGEVRRLVLRCVTPCPGGIHGYYALIRGKRLGSAKARATDGKEVAAGAGSHQWTRLLARVEGLDAFIRTFVLGGDAPQEGRDLDIDDIHHRVIQYLGQVGVGPEDYPLTNADRGRDAVARHVRRLADQHLLRFTRIYHGESSEKRAKHTGRGLRRIIRPLRPGSFAQLDYWRTDKLPKISYPNRYGDSFEIPLPKWYYAVLVDELFSSVLSGFPTLEITPSTDSALECLDRFVHPEQYRRSDFAGGGPMDPGPCFAGELVPALRGTRIDVLRVDNAWANLSDAFIRAAVYQFGAAVNFGPTYTWVTRAVVERVIGNIARLTGKATSPESTVGLGNLRLALDESCRDHNTSPTERLNFSSPVSALTNVLRQSGAGLIVAPLPRETVENSRLLDYFFIRPVRGNLKKGVRPYVQELRRRYVGGALEQETELLRSRGQLVQVEGRIRRYDVRLCDAGIVGGKSLGRLVPDRQQDMLISVRDAINLRRSGSRQRALIIQEAAAAKVRTDRKGKRKQKPDPDALGQARANQDRALHADRVAMQVAMPSPTVDAASTSPSREQEPALRAWNTPKTTALVVVRGSGPRETALGSWSPSGSTSSGRRGGEHE